VKYTLRWRSDYTEAWREHEYESLAEAVKRMMDDTGAFFSSSYDQILRDGGGNLIARRDSGKNSPLEWISVTSPFFPVQKQAFRDLGATNVTVLEEQRQPVFLVRCEMGGQECYGWWNGWMRIDEIEWCLNRQEMDL
jgi:hypothetical protein